MPKVPAHILYPGIVLALLGLSITTCFRLVMASKSDLGPQVVANYYEDSLAWDSIQAKKRATEALGWTIALQFDGDTEGRVTITDGAHAPVEGVDASIELRRPQLADAVSSATLVPVADAPGVYRFEHPTATPGFWDVVLEGAYNDQPILYERRHRVH